MLSYSFVLLLNLAPEIVQVASLVMVDGCGRLAGFPSQSVIANGDYSELSSIIT